MKKTCLFAFTLCFLILCTCAAWFAWDRKIPIGFWHSVLPMPRGEPVSVLIRPNQTVAQIARAFANEGVVTDSARDFSRWLARFGIDRRLIPGRYSLIPASAWDAARQMIGAVPASESVTMVPGTNIYTFEDIFTVSGDALAKLMDDSLYPERMTGFIPDTAEGRLAFLLPDTYLTAESTPEEFIRAASEAWWNELGESVSSADIGEKIEEAAVIASLIEREALWDEERPRIAGVIYNRIEKDMLLQIDAAVVYAHLRKGRKLTRVLYRDLELDSPYNLYKYEGLTPGPICAPSLLSWRAALAPEENGYLYYVADKDGRHIFSETHSGHLQNVKKVRQK